MKLRSPRATAAGENPRVATAGRVPLTTAPPGRLLAELRVPSDGRLARDVRGFTREQLLSLGAADHTIDDAVLLATELFSNAVRHAPGAAVGLRLTYDPGRRTCTVFVDDTSHLPPAPGRLPATAQESGRGLAVVAELAHAWGWHPTASGKSVWFSTRIHPDHSDLV
ncbi:ATP-binding protein [Streptomycetaceae bacterium NBC_01309]